MSSTIRSDSYSESVQRGLHPLVTIPIAPQRRSATTENINRKSVNYPAISSESFPSTRSATISASTTFFSYSFISKHDILFILQLSLHLLVINVFMVGELLWILTQRN
jgi:hypothetical protein